MNTVVRIVRSAQIFTPNKTDTIRTGGFNKQRRPKQMRNNISVSR
jgi:hypothetical protein